MMQKKFIKEMYFQYVKLRNYMVNGITAIDEGCD